MRGTQENQSDLIEEVRSEGDPGESQSDLTEEVKSEGDPGE